MKNLYFHLTFAVVALLAFQPVFLQAGPLAAPNTTANEDSSGIQENKSTNSVTERLFSLQQDQGESAEQKQQAEPKAEDSYLGGYAAGRADGAAEADKTTYGVAGFFCGVCGVGAAALSNPKPGTETLRSVGKSEEYIRGYSQGYSEARKSAQLNSALIGWGIGAVVSLGLYFILLSSAADE